jgi:uncharacterized membrane protein
MMIGDLIGTDRGRGRIRAGLLRTPLFAMNANRFTWIARIIVAAILLQTLIFKFTAAPESVYIFQAVGMEPWGRIASGIAELIAGVLLLIPSRRFAAAGAALSLGVISGAIFFHLTKLGIVVQDDGGQLFVMAVVVFVGALFVLLRERRGLLEWLPGRAAPQAKEVA